MNNTNIEVLAANPEALEANPSSSGQSSDDRIYLLGLAIGLIHYMLPETTIDAPDVIELLLKASMFLLLTLQLLIAFSKYTPPQKLLISLLFFVVVAVGYSTTHWGTVYSLYALVVGAKGVDFSRILNVYFKMGAFLCLSIVAMSLLGIIENIGILAEGHGLDDSVNIRYCMGYIWPTDFASHVFFVLFAYWMARKSHLSNYQIMFFLLIAFLVLHYSDSNLGTGCILLLTVFSIYMRVKEKLADRFKVFSKRIGIFKYAWVLYIPFMFVISVWAIVAYDEGNITWLIANLLLSGRLEIGQRILGQEGFTLWGQKYILRGGTSDANLYNYIDSSYLQSFIIYGVAFSVILAICYMRLSSQAYNRKNYSFLYAILIAGVSGAIAQHFLQIFMNPLLIALTASNISLSNTVDKEDVQSIRKDF